MANRHLYRGIALQTLFEWDFSGTQKKTDDIITRNMNEFGDGSNDDGFIGAIVSGVMRKQKDLDTIIEKAAPDWPLDKISVVDRNILRIGLYELLFGDRSEVPPKVAINEAIELAKTFGSDTSSRFVNGVLGAVYKEIGEPGKEQKSKRIKNVDLADEDVPVETLGGALVYAKKDDDIYVALVHDVFGHWTLTKGHVEEGEELATGIVREVKEELGIAIVVGEEIGGNAYIAYDPDKGKIKKEVKYFLAENDFDELKLDTQGGLDDAKWFKLRDIGDLNFYDDILPIITTAVNILVKK